MSLIEWKDEFELGIGAVDSDHRALVEQINGLHDAAMRNANRQTLLDALDDIYTRIAAHFALEESLMRSIRYMAFAEHKEDHEILLDDLRDIIAQVEAGGDYCQERLSADLDYWFSAHFHRHDARLHKQAQNAE